ncbi:hypothetical protein [Butyrivibrio sp. AE2032]|uniref:hypothetical protein n=1 Tax=Butyrivibrio sp. AE2032 TaxID=1458463 RepID=UPI000558E125|nr:hypothetical protein [Butyrivibrio sp. AE2032]
MRRLKEWFSIRLAKNPGQIVLLSILFFNILFIFLSAFIISRMSLTGTEHLGFLESAYYTVNMILDAGGIAYVVEDIGPQNAIIAITCIIIVIIGMISFTGAVIGYMSNYISSFIEDSNAGNHRLQISDHFVILNWNSRALEIVNDMLYSGSCKRVVVLVSSGKEEVERQIDERLHETVKRENIKVEESCMDRSFLSRKLYCRRHRFKNELTIIVREGDVFSSKQLFDISLQRAAAVVILGEEINDTVCKYNISEKIDKYGNGNALTIKTLMQVSDITSASFSEDNQRIIVEITDDWTWDLVQKIIRSKQVDGKCNIVPIRVNQILGELMSQFSLMPELNIVYNELLSNKGATFFTAPSSGEDEVDFIRKTLAENDNVIPLTIRNDNGRDYRYFMALDERDINEKSRKSLSGIPISINRNFWLEKKKILILGHNSKCIDIMNGFASFISEWGYKDSDEMLLSIVVIDDEKNLEKMNHYKQYPFVIKTVAAELFEKDLICDSINEFLRMNEEDVSVLILSDDLVPEDEIDAGMLTNLVYVQDIINDKVEADPDFDVGSIDVIAEINDPKHHDVVSSYSVKNVVISNRYISKMITQIGEKDAIYNFYQDILVYDTDCGDAFESKEVYIKKAKDFFGELPRECTADQLIRGVFNATYDPDQPPEKQNITMVLGVVDQDGRIVLFGGDQTAFNVKIGPKDKIIVFSNH